MKINYHIEYRPRSMWGFFGYQLLFAIHCIGFICFCIFAFGGTQNINLRNFARSYFCVFILLVVFVIFMFALGMICAGIFALS